jgi:hypothetical protein
MNNRHTIANIVPILRAIRQEMEQPIPDPMRFVFPDDKEFRLNFGRVVGGILHYQNREHLMEDLAELIRLANTWDPRLELSPGALPVHEAAMELLKALQNWYPNTNKSDEYRDSKDTAITATESLIRIIEEDVLPIKETTI